jgi:uncharacterized protein YqgC (DUF456 family)
MTLTVIILIAVIILLLLGFGGSLLPGLPGPPISYSSVFLLFLHPEAKHNINSNWIISLGVIMLIITVLDFFLPVITTNFFGGTKAGARGSNIGLVVGFILSFFTFAFSILIGPLIGAYVGEVMAGNNQEIAFKSALGSFLGFIGGTFVKIVYTVIVAVYIFRVLF